MVDLEMAFWDVGGFFVAWWRPWLFGREATDLLPLRILRTAKFWAGLVLSPSLSFSPAHGQWLGGSWGANLVKIRSVSVLAWKNPRSISGPWAING